MNNLKNYFLFQFFNHTYFWISLSVPYLLFRGLSIEETLALLGIYNLLSMIFEYPTGVIGDHFGHKVSVFWGLLVNGFAFIIMAMPGPKYIYYIAIFLNALSGALISGSDTAILKGISDNYKKDSANYKSLTLVVLFTISATGGYIADVNMVIPIILSGITSFIAIPFLLRIKYSNGIVKQNKGNIFTTANRGIQFVIRDRSIMAIVIIVAVVTGLKGSVKTVIGSFDEIFSLDVEYVGWVIAFTMLARTISTKFFVKLERLGLKIFSFGLIFALTIPIILQDKYGAITSIILAAFCMGYINMSFDVSLNDKLENDIRAGVLSFSSLLERLISSGFLMFYGYSVIKFNYGITMFIVSMLLAVAFLLYNLVNRRFIE